MTHEEKLTPSFQLQHIHIHANTLSSGKISWMRQQSLSERRWSRLKRKTNRDEEEKTESEIEWWMEWSINWLSFRSPFEEDDSLSDYSVPPKQPPMVYISWLIALLPLFAFPPTLSSFLLFSLPRPPPSSFFFFLFGPTINNTEYNTKACHLYLPLHLRPPKIRNSPLIWNKWPSSGKPKPPDSATWFIKGAWSRKLVQLQQKLKLCPHATPNWRWGLKSTILTEPLTKINK